MVSPLYEAFHESSNCLFEQNSFHTPDIKNVFYLNERSRVPEEHYELRSVWNKAYMRKDAHQNVCVCAELSLMMRESFSHSCHKCKVVHPNECVYESEGLRPEWTPSGKHHTGGRDFQTVFSWQCFSLFVVSRLLLDLSNHPLLSKNLLTAAWQQTQVF